MDRASDGTCLVAEGSAGCTLVGGVYVEAGRGAMEGLVSEGLS